MLVLDQAEAIADHLIEWAEGNPSAWFRLTFLEHRGRYGVVLFPDVAASLDRFLRARELNGYAPPPEGVEPIFLSHPLHFVSRSAHMYQQVRARLPNPVSLGILDRPNLPVDHPESVDLRRVRMLGPFQVGGDPAAEQFVRQLIEDADENR